MKEKSSNDGLKYIGAALIFGFTLGFELMLVMSGKPLSGWLGFGGFILAGSCLGWDIW